tara:strand:- start:12 stop:200 length:189 start_codon:yes stop_codon:yes gene_type:complete
MNDAEIAAKAAEITGIGMSGVIVTNVAAKDKDNMAKVAEIGRLAPVVVFLCVFGYVVVSGLN